MTEFQEFPKMIYHPKTGDNVIVRSADEEAIQLEAWGVNEPPKIELRAPDAPKAAPKPRAARKAKAAN